MTAGPSEDATVAAMCAALSPYPWRRFTPELFARLALAAADRQALHDLLATVPGTAAGAWGLLEPVGPDDARLAPAVRFLGTHRWNELQLTALCGALLGAIRG